jgi:hypothetical protein
LGFSYLLEERNLRNTAFKSPAKLVLTILNSERDLSTIPNWDEPVLPLGSLV